MALAGKILERIENNKINPKDGRQKNEIRLRDEGNSMHKQAHSNFRPCSSNLQNGIAVRVCVSSLGARQFAVPGWPSASRKLQGGEPRVGVGVAGIAGVVGGGGVEGRSASAR